MISYLDKEILLLTMEFEGFVGFSFKDNNSGENA